MREKEIYLNKELEERLKKAEELKRKIENPEPERLLLEHRRMEKEYEDLMDDRTRLYEAAKVVVNGGYKLVCRPDKNEIGFVQSYSQARYPEVSYANEGRFTLPITSGGRFEELTPEQFLAKIVKGDFKPLDHLCLNCHKLIPFGKSVCENCGHAI